MTGGFDDKQHVLFFQPGLFSPLLRLGLLLLKKLSGSSTPLAQAAKKSVEHANNNFSEIESRRFCESEPELPKP